MALEGKRVGTHVRRKNACANLVAMGLLLSLTACENIYGIVGTAVTSSPPDKACILSALSQTPGVHGAHEASETYDGWLIAGNGPRHGAEIQYYSYKVGSQPEQTTTLEIESHSAGQYHYRNTMLTLGARIPKQEIYDAYPVMVAAATEVSQMCDLDIASKMQHTCIGYDCEKLGRSARN